MNSLHIIGNLTADPELRTTPNGKTVCSFTVAVNRKKTRTNADPGADFFRVSAWNELGEVCAKYLSKGRKVSIIGPVSARGYSNSSGEPQASLEVRADDIEFLTPKGSGFTQVDVDDNPFA